MAHGAGVPWSNPSASASWACGWEDFEASDTDNTNILCLLGTSKPEIGTPFGRYTRNAGVYKCPADTYTAVQRTVKLPRLRSVSMNAWVGEGSVQSDESDNTWLNYHRLTDITAPPPAMLWVFSDEHPDSINDGWLVNSPISSPSASGGWTDLPGSYHSAGDVLSFADGHADYKHWQDGYSPTKGGTVQPVEQFQRNGFTDSIGLDIYWLGLRTTAASH